MLKDVLSRALSGVKSHAENLDKEVASTQQQIEANEREIDRLVVANGKLARKAERRRKLSAAIIGAVNKFESEDEGE